ncbi:copper transporter [Lentinula aff. detonsa]|nr:copper transporter [Lentinula aff. detonsa]
MESTDEGHILHWSFCGTHILFPGLRLTSFETFTAASLLVSVICFSERFVSFIYEQEWRPPFIARARWQNALWKTALYWIMTLLRFLYMLCAMSFHFGLLLVIVTSLAVAHLLVEIRRDIQSSDTRGYAYSYTSIETFHDESPDLQLPPARLRSKSKPDSIFIHPQHSNIARADAAALQLGLGGPTERVSGSVYQLREEASWKSGTGKDVARALLGTSRHNGGSDSDSEM